MGKEKKKEETVIDCPMARFCRDLEKAFRGKSKFFEHMTRSRIEFLKGVKTLVDERIEDLENRASRKAEKKITKIEVED
jgi:hypothetical protein